MLSRVGRQVGGSGRGSDQDDPEPRVEAPRLSDQRAGAAFGKARVHDQERGVVGSDQLQGRGDPLGLSIDPKVMKAKKAPQ